MFYQTDRVGLSIRQHGTPEKVTVDKSGSNISVLDSTDATESK